ncbi:hypothetical protein R1sor_019925 [Riccia sorocarpa]|uniref:Uncharacterized protein n=1 Tax=Riccia sorocarpa TaxID=122646 RepID=A0ABD3IDV5_9MARC
MLLPRFLTMTEADTLEMKNGQGTKHMIKYLQPTLQGFLQTPLLPYEQVAQMTRASIPPDDFIAPADFCSNHAKHPINLPYFTMKSSAQDTQVTSFLIYAAHVLEFLMSPPSQQAAASILWPGRREAALLSSAVTAWVFPHGHRNTPTRVVFASSTSCLDPASNSFCSCRVFHFAPHGARTPEKATGSGSSWHARWKFGTLGSSSKVVNAPYRTCTFQPTYSTNYKIRENHTASVLKVSLEGKSSQKEVLPSANLSGSLRKGFLKILSMDKLGFVHLWVGEAKAKAARDSDEPGLHPEGRHYLVRTGSISVVPRAAHSLENGLRVLPESSTFATIRGQAQEILLAMNDGSILKTSHADNTVAIFTMDRPSPWDTCTLPWDENQGHIVAVQWSPFESTVFLVAVNTCKIHVFDLTNGLANPSFIMTASNTGDVVVHLMKQMTPDRRANSLEHVLLSYKSMN